MTNYQYTVSQSVVRAKDLLNAHWVISQHWGLPGIKWGHPNASPPSSQLWNYDAPSRIKAKPFGEYPTVMEIRAGWRPGIMGSRGGPESSSVVKFKGASLDADWDPDNGIPREAFGDWYFSHQPKLVAMEPENTMEGYGVTRGVNIPHIVDMTIHCIVFQKHPTSGRPYISLHEGYPAKGFVNAIRAGSTLVMSDHCLPVTMTSGDITTGVYNVFGCIPNGGMLVIYSVLDVIDMAKLINDLLDVVPSFPSWINDNLYWVGKNVDDFNYQIAQLNILPDQFIGAHAKIQNQVLNDRYGRNPFTEPMRRSDDLVEIPDSDLRELLYAALNEPDTLSDHPVFGRIADVTRYQDWLGQVVGPDGKRKPDTTGRWNNTPRSSWGRATGKIQFMPSNSITLKEAVASWSPPAGDEPPEAEQFVPYVTLNSIEPEPDPDDESEDEF